MRELGRSLSAGTMTKRGKIGMPREVNSVVADSFLLSSLLSPPATFYSSPRFLSNPPLSLRCRKIILTSAASPPSPLPQEMTVIADQRRRKETKRNERIFFFFDILFSAHESLTNFLDLLDRYIDSLRPI